MDSAICVDNLRYKDEKLEPVQIDKVLEVLDNKKFGVKSAKDLKEIIEKIRGLKEYSDGEQSD